ncbi:1-phosphatidylinositol-4-phosphate 5-kinase [Aureococcus anophagefferens]|uniref:1-phosphatidylinositol-4-phosphate 5-kinase n=1 Tax=Aureococcus anophagefferens TaxID=44056 RepID=A0ABR1FZH8_AURAN
MLELGSLKLPTTFATHLHVLAINNTNLVAITLFWFLCGSTFALGYATLGRHDDASEFRNLRVGFGYVCSYAAALLLPMKGCVDFMVWLLPHEPRDVADALRLPVAVAAEAPDESEPRPPSTVGEEPELKFALQREIFAYMKVGIVAGATRSDAARLSGDPAKVRAAERFALTAVASDGAPPSLQERLLTFQRFARLALSPTIEDQRELRRRCCADFADDGDARRSSNDRLSLVARVLEDDGDLALAPLAGDVRPSEDDARPTFQWTTSKRARKRRPFSRGDVGFRCWAPVEIGAGNG